MGKKGIAPVIVPYYYTIQSDIEAGYGDRGIAVEGILQPHSVVVGNSEFIGGGSTRSILPSSFPSLGYV